MIKPSVLCCYGTLAIGVLFVAPFANAQSGKSAEDFFESRIRPALIEHCLECHAVNTEINGGLSLDSAAGWQRGGDTGVAIEKGKSDVSLLVKALEYKDPKLQMPPDGQLPESVVSDFKEWIRKGAVDPRPEVQPPKGSTALPLDRAQEHWAYRPISSPAVPNLPASGAIDAFVQQSLQQAKTTATEPASRAALIRRLKFDLHGLPPTPDEIRSFESDPSSNAYERLVDSLLASPRYAERMARRWLDVVRYAESLTLRGFVLGNAWRYRDYCIQGFAEDRPFDEMLREQIAGDLMTADDLAIRQRQRVATTFWLLGNSNLEEQDKQQLEMDFIDEQIDTVGRAVLGQTIACARCHDHKFDPIPTRDYYALAGTLKASQVLEHENVSKWIEAPLPSTAREEKQFAGIAVQLKQLTKDIDARRKQLTLQTKRSTPMVAVSDVSGIVVDDTQAKKIGEWQTSNSVSVYVGEGYIHDSNEGRGSKTVSFEPTSLAAGNYEVRLAYASSGNRSTQTRVSVFSADGEAHLSVDQQTPASIEGLWHSLGRYRFEKDGQAFVIVSNEGANGIVIADAVQFLPDSPPSEVAIAEPRPSVAEVTDSVEDLNAGLKKLEASKKKLEAKLREQPMSMAMRTREDAADLPIHIRGDVHNLGKVVPRGTLQVVSVARSVQPDEKPFDRLDLAEWMTAPEQPLVARVLANRIWSWMMGEGIVRTVDNFGTTGEAPSHPELLDYLANQLRDHQWSVRRVVREIVLSDAYQRSSATIEGSERTDPDNRMLWRGHRRRLDAESIRDAMLAISGQLKLEMYGRRLPESLKSDYNYVHNDVCRSLYIPILRNALPDVFEVFDIADPSTVVGKRNRSTIATQALWMMNHPWVLEQSRATAERLLNENSGDRESVLEQASLHILGRKLSDAETTAIGSFLEPPISNRAASESAIDLEQLTVVIQSLYQSIDFRFPQ